MWFLVANSQSYCPRLDSTNIPQVILYSGESLKTLGPPPEVACIFQLFHIYSGVFSHTINISFD